MPSLVFNVLGGESVEVLPEGTRLLLQYPPTMSMLLLLRPVRCAYCSCVLKAAR